MGRFNIALKETMANSLNFKGIRQTATSFVALKALGMKPAQFYIKHCQKFDVAQEKKLPVSEPGFEYLDVFFNQITHLESTKDKLEKVLFCVFQYQCLEETGFFKNIKVEGDAYIFLVSL